MNNFNRLRRGPYVAYAFLAIQILVFVSMELYGLVSYGTFGGSESGSILIQFGAMSREAVVVSHEWWRFITPIFVHIGFTHILINSITLYFMGAQLENLIGHMRFFFLYLLSGILGNVLSFGFSNVNAISAGASTSLFGMFAAVIALSHIYKYNPAIQAYAKSMRMFIFMNIFFNLFSPSVDILGHIGGALGGYLMMNVIGAPKSYNGRTINEGVTIHTRIINGIIYLFIFIISLVYFYKKIQNSL